MFVLFDELIVKVVDFCLIKSRNYQIDTYKKKIYIYGISLTTIEKDEVLKEAKQILDVEDVFVRLSLLPH